MKLGNESCHSGQLNNPAGDYKATAKAVQQNNFYIYLKFILLIFFSILSS